MWLAVAAWLAGSIHGDISSHHANLASTAPALVEALSASSSVDHQLGEAALQARENRRHFDATTPHLVDFVMVSRTHSPPHKSQSF